MVNTALADHGLEVYIDRKDGKGGFIGLGVVDPNSPEVVTTLHRGTGCCWSAPRHALRHRFSRNSSARLTTAHRRAQRAVMMVCPVAARGI